MAVVAIAAGVAAVGAYAGAVSGRKGAKKARDAQREAAKKAGRYLEPANIAIQTQRLQPLLRQQMATGLGSQFQQQVGANLAAHGLTGTGVGEALRNASFGIPEIEAFRQALNMGYDIQKGKAAIAMGGAPQPALYQNPNALGSALTAGAGAYFTGSSMLNQPQTQVATKNANPAANMSLFNLLQNGYTIA